MTGGHHSSALPVIKELKRRVPDVNISWFGHRYSQRDNKADTLEFREIKTLKIPFYDLKAGKFYKTSNPISIIKIPLGFFQSIYLLKKIRPQLIMSFGGYLAVPAVFAGWFLGIPAITHEQTVTTGYANRVISLFASKILISFKESAKYFKRSKTIYTGIPIRETVFKRFSNKFDPKNKMPTIYISGGKTGSHKMNKIVEGSLESLLSFCNVIHQCGDHSKFKDYERLVKKTPKLKSLKGSYFPLKYVFGNEIGEVYSRADLVISRAGAHTTAELLALNKPCILIPIPWVSHNEQYKNAEMLEKGGLSLIINEKDFSETSLVIKVRGMLGNINKYHLRQNVIDDRVKRNAQELIANEIISSIKKKK